MEEIRRILSADPQLQNPTRFAIMLLLRIKRRMFFSELQKALKLTPGNLGSHLKKLEDAGYVKIRKVFTPIRILTMVSISDYGERALLDYVDNLRKVLKTVIEEEELIKAVNSRKN